MTIIELQGDVFPEPEDTGMRRGPNNSLIINMEKVSEWLCTFKSKEEARKAFHRAIQQLKQAPE